MRDTPSARYLVPEAFDQILRFVKMYPVLAIVLFLVIYALVITILRKAFGRLGYEVLMMAVLICAIAVFLSGAGYTFFHFKGFQFGW